MQRFPQATFGLAALHLHVVCRGLLQISFVSGPLYAWVGTCSEDSLDDQPEFVHGFQALSLALLDIAIRHEAPGLQHFEAPGPNHSEAAEVGLTAGEVAADVAVEKLSPLVAIARRPLEYLLQELGVPRLRLRLWLREHRRQPL